MQDNQPVPGIHVRTAVRALSKLGRHSLAIFMLQTPLYLSGMAAGVE